MNQTNNNVENIKWTKVVIKSQTIIACVVFLVEVVNNALLYTTRSQGYGPDTIVEKLLRYLVLTSAINFILVIFSVIASHRVKNEIDRSSKLMFFITLMCTNVAFSHYQFSIVFAIFVIPMMLSIIYEEWGLIVFTFVASLVGETIALLARFRDTAYNQDIGPEIAISYALLVSIFVFSRIIISTLQKRRDEVKNAVIQVEKANAESEKMALSLKMLETLAGTLEAKDKYTNGHSLRVAIYATILAESLGYNEDELAMLRNEALLHDIGKIGVPDIILNKPDKLSDTEFGLIKSHTVIGADILKNMVAVPNAYEVAKFHHERFDGKGYPNSLKGKDIPYNARIVCIADAYDAMSSDRIYRKALAPDIVRKELINGRGTQFDPELLDAFVALFDDNKLEIKYDTISVDSKNDTNEGVLEDIERVISRMSTHASDASIFADFDKFYIYMRNIGIRYNRTIEVLSIDIIRKDNNKYNDENAIADVLQVAIRKNIRAIDVYYRFSLSKHMIILMDAGEENIDIIEKRINFDFNNSEGSDGYELKFFLNESIVPSGNGKGKVN